MSDQCFLNAQIALRKAANLLAAQELLQSMLKENAISDEGDFFITRSKHELYDWHESLIREALTEFADCECASRKY